MAKMFEIKPQGQKLSPLENKYIPSDCTNDANIWMAGAQGGDLLSRKFILPNSPFWLRCYMLKDPYSILSFLYLPKMNPLAQDNEACNFLEIQLLGF